MASNKPQTYENRVVFKNALSALSECRRVALKTLPSDFFIHYFVRIINEIKTNPNFNDVLSQFHQYYWDVAHKQQVTQDAADMLVALLEEELDAQNIPNKEMISKTYGEFLVNYRWCMGAVAHVKQIM